MKNIKVDSFLLVFLLLSSILWILGAYAKHPWGDDFAQYLIQAKNFASGLPFENSSVLHNPQNTMYGPPHYPPFYSLLLSPFVKLFGLNFKILIALNNVFLTILGVSCYMFFKKSFSRLLALIMALLITCSLPFLELKTQLLSDLPCAMLILVYIAYRCNKKERTVTWYIILGLITTAVLLTRTQYVLLPISELLFGGYLILYGIINRKEGNEYSLTHFFRNPEFIIPTLGLTLYLIFNNTLFATEGNSLQYYQKLVLNFDNLMKQVDINSAYMLDQFLSFFQFHSKVSTLNTYNKIFNIMLFIMSLLGFFITSRNRLKLYHIFYLVVIVFHLILPVHQGVRFLLPIIPLYLYFAFSGLQAISINIIPKIKSGFIILPVLLFFFSGKDAFGKYLRPYEEDSPFTIEDKTCFDWLEQNIAKKDLVIFNKPRALSLFTDQKAMVLSWQVPFDKNLKTARKCNAKYVLVREGLDEGWYKDFVWQTNCASDSVQINKKYKLYILK